MSLRTYAVPLALVSLGVGLGILSDRSPGLPSEIEPLVELESAPVASPPPVDAAPSVVSADPEDPHYAAPEQSGGSEQPMTLEAVQIGPPPSVPDGTEGLDAYGQPTLELGAAPPIEDPAGELPGPADLPPEIVSGDEFAPLDGAPPYEVITTNPMNCIPDGAPGCVTGVPCCDGLICIQDRCIQAQ